jgi:hypothetical protein
VAQVLGPLAVTENPGLGSSPQSEPLAIRASQIIPSILSLLRCGTTGRLVIQSDKGRSSCCRTCGQNAAVLTRPVLLADMEFCIWSSATETRRTKVGMHINVVTVAEAPLSCHRSINLPTHIAEE